MIKSGLILLSCLHLIILLSVQFTAWPEMFSYPYLINNGFKPYLDIAFPYEPILPLLLAGLYKVFGTELFVLQIYTWFIIIFSDLLIFLISKKIIGNKFISLLPIALYIVMQPVVDGNMLWFDLATVPFLLLAFATFIYLQGLKKFLFLGFFLGLAFFTKQQVGITMAILGIYFLVIKSFKGFFLYSLGFLIPVICVAGYIIGNNISSEYFFWTVTVPLKWYPSFPGYTHVPTIKETALMGLMFGSVVTATLLKLKNKDPQLIIAALIFLGAFLTAFPRFELFRVQPSIATLMILLCFVIAGSGLKKVIILVLPIILVSWLLWVKAIPNIGAPTRFYSQEDINLAEKIRSKNSSKGLYLLGVNSLQYVLTGKFPPKPWVDNYVWYMEIPGMQEKVLAGLKRENLDLILKRTPSLGNWFDLGSYQPQRIVDYINMNYNKKEIINSEIEIWIRKN